MNGIERHLEVLQKHLKQIKLTFTLISILILLAISAVAMVAEAQEPAATTSENTATPTTTSAPANNADQANRGNGQSASEQNSAAQNQMNNRSEQAKTVLSERAQKRITNLAANISNRMEATIARLEKISVRLQSRIDKINASGADTTIAQEYIDEAKTSLETAKSNLENIDVEVQEFVGSESPAELWRETRNTYTSTRDEIRTAHSALREAVMSLKNNVQRNNIDVPEEEDEETATTSQEEA